ncbi:MAG TPA: response regulator FixJ [Methylocystis sp.]|nr:response regulator FixJ [Methylocystis sp.]
MSGEQFIHIVEDDADVLQSIRMLLETEGFNVKTYASAENFLDLADPQAEGCVVTDVRMPGMSGVELLQQIKVRGFTLPVIVITAHGDIPLAVNCMKLGAIDLLEKPFNPETLIAAIRQALARLDDTSGEDAQELRARLASLSARESDVLKGLLKGLPNKIIAHELGISPRTVEIHRANVMRKTRAGSLAELVRMAIGASDVY